MVVVLDTSETINLNYLHVIPRHFSQDLDQSIVNVDIHGQHGTVIKSKRVFQSDTLDFEFGRCSNINFDPNVLNVCPELRRHRQETKLTQTLNTEQHFQNISHDSLSTKYFDRSNKSLSQKTKRNDKHGHRKGFKKAKLGTKIDQLVKRHPINLADMLGQGTSTNCSKNTICDNKSEASFSVSAEICEMVVKKIQELSLQDGTFDDLLKITKALGDLEQNLKQNTLDTTLLNGETTEIKKPPAPLRHSQDIVTLCPNKFDPFTCTSTDCSVLRMMNHNDITPDDNKSSSPPVGTCLSSQFETAEVPTTVVSDSTTKGTSQLNLTDQVTPPFDDVNRSSTEKIADIWNWVSSKSKDPIVDDLTDDSSFQYQADQFDQLVGDCVGTTTLPTNIDQRDVLERETKLAQLFVEPEQESKSKSKLTLLNSIESKNEKEYISLKTTLNIPPSVNTAVGECESSSNVYQTQSNTLMCTVQKVDIFKPLTNHVDKMDNLKFQQILDDSSSFSSMRAITYSVEAMSDVRSGDDIQTRCSSSITDFQFSENGTQITNEHLYPFNDLQDFNEIDRKFLDFVAQFHRSEEEERKSKSLDIMDEQTENNSMVLSQNGILQDVPGVSLISLMEPLEVIPCSSKESLHLSKSLKDRNTEPSVKLKNRTGKTVSGSGAQSTLQTEQEHPPKRSDGNIKKLISKIKDKKKSKKSFKQIVPKNEASQDRMNQENKTEPSRSLGKNSGESTTTSKVKCLGHVGKNVTTNKFQYSLSKTTGFTPKVTQETQETIVNYIKQELEDCVKSRSKFRPLKDILHTMTLS